jgi:hypothetical protein
MAVVYKAGSSGSVVKDIQKLLNKQLKPSFRGSTRTASSGRRPWRR